MKLSLRNNYPILLILIVLVVQGNSYGQFAPHAGQPGTTAIHMDSSIFVSWAVQCSVNLGPENISDPFSNQVSTGDSTMAIGPPGNGVVSLGDGGSAILTFESPIENGPGWDFAVFENSFSNDFLELGFVEVSSNNVDFYRFPASSNTQDSLQIDTFGTIDAQNINNLAGKYRATYGTPFDLEELSNFTMLDINSITSIKIIDVIGSIDSAYCNYDQNNNKINDPWPTPFSSSGFDLDAIGVIHQLPSNIVELKNSETFIENIKISNNLIEILLNHVSSQKINFTIVNLSGQIVLKSNQYYAPKNYNSINLNNLIRGFYILYIEGESLNESIKILIP